LFPRKEGGWKKKRKEKKEGLEERKKKRRKGDLARKLAAFLVFLYSTPYLSEKGEEKRGEEGKDGRQGEEKKTWSTSPFLR